MGESNFDQVLPEDLGKYAVVCSKHFSDKQVIAKSEGYSLRKGAAPNIFPNNGNECTDVEYLETSFDEPLDVGCVEFDERPSSHIHLDYNWNDDVKKDDDSYMMNGKQFICNHCGHINFATFVEQCSNNLINDSNRSDISLTDCSNKPTCALKRSLFEGISTPTKRQRVHYEDDENVSPHACSTPISYPKKKRRIFHPGDVKENCDLSPKSSKKYISVLRRTILRQRLRSKIVCQQNRRKSTKIASFKMVLKDLKDKGLISDNAAHTLKSGTTDEISRMDEIRRGKVQNKYPLDVRAFALTLNFYSPQAYRYVRKTYANKLPAPRTIRKWYESIDGSPGLTKEALIALSMKKKDLAAKGIPLKLCMSFDGMSIRKQIEFNVHKNKYFGYVDFGGMNIVREGDAIAKEAWVVLLTAINAHFKIPVGYFLVHGLTASEKAGIITNTLTTLDEYDIDVDALVYDGDPGNIAMINELNPTTSNPTYFLHPSTNQKIHAIVDICHMIKLVRNTLASKKVLIDENGGLVEWRYIPMLHELQADMQTRLGNKLSKKHVFFQRQKMKVKLATQTLSRSVADALKTLRGIDPKFEGCGPLIEFIEIFDSLFDICNSKSKFGKLYKRPLCTESEVDFFGHFDKSTRYINGLKLIDKKLIIASKSHTGFTGFLQGITSIRNIYNELCKNGPLEYLLTYKLSQDHLETFLERFEAVEAGITTQMQSN